MAGCINGKVAAKTQRNCSWNQRPSELRLATLHQRPDRNHLHLHSYLLSSDQGPDMDHMFHPPFCLNPVPGHAPLSTTHHHSPPPSATRYQTPCSSPQSFPKTDCRACSSGPRCLLVLSLPTGRLHVNGSVASPVARCPAVPSVVLPACFPVPVDAGPFGLVCFRLLSSVRQPSLLLLLSLLLFIVSFLSTCRPTTSCHSALPTGSSFI